VHLSPEVPSVYERDTGYLHKRKPQACVRGHFEAVDAEDEYDERNVPVWKRSQPLPCPDRQAKE